ncbi:MBL fold metallo-hydrolase [Nocardia camponoti]|uniref:MBL fold metallo-hydrolase n=1 Tax=Nocardia camponoti TaxID=1616106 RepID=A0A917QP90_9NOCA|nr:MBL fold metallo-hydrolase [Nocardia camponoti]GGK61542.1 MBL fold metallo-hydrolase [Nocardia camponoti]
MTETITRPTLIDALHTGGPTLRFGYGGLTWLTDPTFDEPGDYPGPIVLHKLTGPAVSVDDIGAIDVVLLSHDQHADNLDNAGRALLGRVETVLSTPDAAARISGVRGLDPWETVRVGDVDVTAVPALHGPVGCEPVAGVVTGFVLRAAGEPVVYVSGDNASIDVVASIVERIGRIDVAVLHIGAANAGRFGDADVTLNARTAVQATEVLGDALIVPVHADGWAHFTETLEYLALTFGFAGRSEQLRIPVRGEIFAV